MPPSLRSPPLAPSHRSLGHFRPTRGTAPPAGGSAGCRLSATLTPTASDRPDQFTGANGIPKENVSESPAWLCQARPMRPRPAVCCSATSNTGSTCPARARRISSVLVESTLGNTSTVNPGSCGATASHRASAGQRSGALMPGCSALGPLARPGPGAGHPVFVVDLLARRDVAQRCDENAAIAFIGETVGVAAVVDPSRRVATVLRVDHAVFIHMEVERVVRLQRVVRVAVLRLLPGDDLAGVLDQHLALGDILHGKNALAMHARAAGLDAAAGGNKRGGGGGGEKLFNL